MAPKRKATSPVRPSPSKKRETAKASSTNDKSNGTTLDHPHSDDHPGIIQREFYPPEISNKRCEAYNNGEIPRPLTLLAKTLKETREQREKMAVGEAVVHWFKRDLRTSDNRALSMASAKAKENNIPLICVFIISPQDYQAHLTSPARVDFELRTLHILQQDLAEQHIPLYIPTIPHRKDVPTHLLEKCRGWGAKHIYCNIEYEVDELRRETRLVRDGLDQDISFTALHDDVCVPPGTLMTGQGKQYSVYSPWYRAWLRHLHDHPHLLSASPPPTPNPPAARDRFSAIFSAPIPPAPENKRLSDDDRDRLTHLWPAGEHEAHARLSRFLTDKVAAYKATRDHPAANSTALLSVHFATGTLAARTAVRAARAANPSSHGHLDTGVPGITTWIAELAWRDFYKHVLAHWPYLCMSKPFKPETAAIRWEHDPPAFARWCAGQTGFPLVDAAMRQLNALGYMHNRCRMLVASFLAKDLLLDWRRGERYFMERLIDGDFASNNGGWGFSASTGVDPQPYFRVFNPVLQSERFDAEGEFIRKWVPELAGVAGRAVHDPYGRGAGAEAARRGYPRMMVEHRGARQRALERYKEGLGRGAANVGGVSDE